MSVDPSNGLTAGITLVERAARRDQPHFAGRNDTRAARELPLPEVPRSHVDRERWAAA